jgi:hypothetical protein
MYPWHTFMSPPCFTQQQQHFRMISNASDTTTFFHIHLGSITRELHTLLEVQYLLLVIQCLIVNVCRALVDIHKAQYRLVPEGF